MAYLLIANLDQSKYASLENGTASQHWMKNNQYPKDLISAIYIMKNNCQNDYRTWKIEHKTSKHENSIRQNRSWDKEERVTEE